jgi:hypothetical protein
MADCTTLFGNLRQNGSASKPLLELVKCVLELGG